MSAIEQQYKAVQQNLKEVGDDVRNYAKETKTWKEETNARLSSVEQLVVSENFSPHSSFLVNQHTIGARTLDGLDENTAFASLKDWNVGTCRVKLNAPIRAALTNESGATSDDSYIAGQAERRGFVIEAQRPLRLLDALPSRPTTSDSVEFIQLGSTGDASEQVNEGDEKAEIDVDGELATANIVTIAAHTTASRQVISDHSTLQGAIDRMVTHKLLSRLEHQIINGVGGQGKINGLLAQAVAFIPTIGVTPADIIGESLTRQADNGYVPNLVLMNPLDWFRIQITKSTTDEEYIFGSPTMPVPPALWNASIIRTPSVPEGTVLTVDTMFATVLDREAPSVMLSNSHKDYFTRNLLAILGELRAGLEVLDVFAVYKMSIEASS